ncbi:MAG TPA: mercury methylation corrinoid protein HgcA [bacterium]|nr:mercury methylation corrinoid protein HgcA [bacterium]
MSTEPGRGGRDRPGFTRVGSLWTLADVRGAVRCRLTRFATRYSVSPGLYALGRPRGDSPVLVTGNYKLTFDILRRDLSGVDCWILVLETRGMSVWCASAQGSFGTEELCVRMARTRLADVVSHRELTLPRLCSASVQAPEVLAQTGFHVRWGPVQSRHIPEYLKTSQVTSAMERVDFKLRDRLVLVPMEVGKALKLFLVFAFVALIYAGLTPGGVALQRAWTGVLPLLALGLGSIGAGSVLAPSLLPWIPVPSFTVKGVLLGAIVNGALLHGAGLARGMDPLLLASCWCFFPGAAGYLAFSFAGAATFGSVEDRGRELRLFLPFYGAAAAATAVTMVLSKLEIWGSL